MASLQTFEDPQLSHQWECLLLLALKPICPTPKLSIWRSTISKNCSQRPYLSLHYQNKNIPATPKHPANEKLCYLAQLDYPNDLEVNFPLLSYISHQIKGIDYLNICLKISPCCRSSEFTNHFCSYKYSRH